MGFPKRLKELRESRGLSQDALADALGIPRSSITHYENSVDEEKERLPRKERLEKLADFFGVSVDYLLGRTNDPSPTRSAEVFHKIDDPDDEFFLQGYLESSEEEKKEMRRYFYEMIKRRKRK